MPRGTHCSLLSPPYLTCCNKLYLLIWTEYLDLEKKFYYGENNMMQNVTLSFINDTACKRIGGDWGGKQRDVAALVCQFVFRANQTANQSVEVFRSCRGVFKREGNWQVGHVSTPSLQVVGWTNQVKSHSSFLKFKVALTRTERGN